MFMFLIQNRALMRKMEAKLLIAVLLLSVSVFSINASAEGEDIIIESDMTWSDDMSLSQNVRVLNGGSLSLVDSQLTVSSNVQIFVDSSSSLRVIFFAFEKFNNVGSRVKVITNDVINPKVIIQPKSIIGFISLKIKDKKAIIVVITV